MYVVNMVLKVSGVNFLSAFYENSDGSGADFRNVVIL
jgi:hypothetical protein